ncbi:hypothetical protein BWI96_14350 [Siphonobacter sp. SORGH_AS_0500]|nr:hypothetical protein BWI96_14315 [Siphonobacter sp. SORGH_AS_0500]PKK35921.1 hypothetical protein BWI96_14350 [Siphonobacter sp. SORGH_AS_0500]
MLARVFNADFGNSVCDAKALKTLFPASTIASRINIWVVELATTKNHLLPRRDFIASLHCSQKLLFGLLTFYIYLKKDLFAKRGLL